MPELPEVETVRRSLERAVLGRRLVRVDASGKRLRHPLPLEALHALARRRLVALRRRAKVLLLDFEAPTTGCGTRETALVHLGMSGRMLIGDGAGPLALHEHVRFHFEDGAVSFVDPRRFGSIELTATDALDAHPRIAGLGPEPLSDALSGEHLHRASRGRRVALRNFLLDGHVVAGVGNIYANEACYHAGLKPGRSAGRLTRPQADRLAQAIRTVLTHAVEAGGTTLADGGYVDGEGRSGWFQVRLAVYARAGEPCPACGAPVRSRVIGQRTAFYCAACQH